MSVTKYEDGTIIFEGEADTRRYQMIAQYHALKLETLGLKFSKGSIAEMIRRQHGMKSKRKAKLLEEFGAYLKEIGVRQ